MSIRAGKIEDITDIMNVIKEAVKNMESREIHQWDDVYPCQEVILKDINENTLYVSVNEIGMVQGIIVLNEHQDIAYEAIEWKYNSGRQLIIHRLCIHPNYQGKGIARELIKFAEDFGTEQKYETIRLDAFIPNIRACRMYEKSGYQKRGIVTFRKGDFFCYEKELCNPWQLIDLATYENHMSSDEVYQLQTLNQITKEQLQDNKHTYVGVLGVAGGNGLDNIDILKTQKVYAVDINKNYLDICKQRYEHLGNTLETICGNLTDDDFILPSTNLLICNLIIEYIGEKEFISVINKNRINVDIVACVIQKNNDNFFVSASELNSHFDPILSIHHDISENKLKHLFSTIGFTCIKYKKYILPNGKEFIRMDFQSSN